MSRCAASATSQGSWDRRRNARPALGERLLRPAVIAGISSRGISCNRCMMSPTVGAIAIGLAFTTWFAALIVTAKNGISSVELGHPLGAGKGLDSKKSWRWNAKRANRAASRTLASAALDSAAREIGRAETPIVAATGPEGSPRRARLGSCSRFSTTGDHAIRQKTSCRRDRAGGCRSQPNPHRFGTKSRAARAHGVNMILGNVKTPELAGNSVRLMPSVTASHGDRCTASRASFTLLCGPIPYPDAHRSMKITDKQVYISP